MKTVHAPVLRRERTAAVHVPYTAHATPTVVRTRSGDYVQCFRLEGAPFESADDADINRWHEQLNVLWRSIAAPGVAIWTHVVRRRDHSMLTGRCAAGFAAQLDARYRARLAGEAMWVNELYLSLLYRSEGSAAESAGARALRRAGNRGRALARWQASAALEACEKLAAQVSASLARYRPVALGLDVAGGVPWSGMVEFLASLANGERVAMAAPRGPIADALVTARLLFGREVIEYRTAAASRLGAMLGIKEYPALTTPGVFNRLLAAPFPFVATQSFAFLAKGTAQGLLARQYHRMTNAGDLAVSQAEALKAALDAVASNEFVMGDHHFSLQVLSEAYTGAAVSEEEAAQRIGRLNDAVAQARTLLADSGMVVAREDIALEAAFWAQLPGNFAYRLRRSPITSRNFAAFVPWHNHPAGRQDGNHWGEALTLFKSSAGSPYFFSLHASDPNDPEGGSRRDTGHTFLCGPTGSGKTVLLGFLVAQLTKCGARQVIFDKDRGLEILVRALGGEYLPIRPGLPSGMNPLTLAPQPENLAFLREWLRVLAGSERALTVREAADLDTALAGTMGLAEGSRRLSRLVEFLDPTDAEGVGARLSRWCARPDRFGRAGEDAWVFDNAEDSVAALLGVRGSMSATSERRSGEGAISHYPLTGVATCMDSIVVGFDVTAFLDAPRLREAVALYLFHLVRQRLDGTRTVVWMDEFSRLLADPAFTAFAKDGLKTWRKLNGVAGFATQSPSDVIESVIARTLIEQSPTKIFFPNPDASATDYREGFGLTAREFALVRDELAPGSRRFLVKQGQESVVCELDLKGMEVELAVISGRLANVAVVERLRAECGGEPEHWLPRFAEFIQSRRVEP